MGQFTGTTANLSMVGSADELNHDYLIPIRSNPARAAVLGDEDKLRILEPLISSTGSRNEEWIRCTRRGEVEYHPSSCRTFAASWMGFVLR